MNRSLGRVGLEVGTAVHSKSGSSSSSSTRDHLDALHRSLSGTSTGGPKTVKTYVDNAYNRKLGRVGLPYGSALDTTTGSSSYAGAKTYADNDFNRRLGRVGKPLGSCPVSRAQKSKSQDDSSACCRQPKYDFFEPVKNFDAEDMNVRDVMDQIMRYKESVDENQRYLVEKALEGIRRHEAAKTYSCRTTAAAAARSAEWIKGGEIIEYEDLALGERIGGGGFGDVFIALWNDKQVAVKKLRVQRVSQTKKRQFQDEVQVYSQLDHPCIVKFFGVCATPPNLAIIMEFMSRGSLYDVLHVETRSLDWKDKLQMISDCLSALTYLHEKSITHRDIKSMNILVNDDYTHCKLSDFGLALKEEGRSSASVAAHSVVGTLKYSPPEVVQGDNLTVEDFKRADIYSLGVVGVELITEEEPYDGMNQHQVRRAILNGEVASVDKIIDADVKDLLSMALSAKPTSRPPANLLYNNWRELY